MNVHSSGRGFPSAVKLSQGFDSRDVFSSLYITSANLILNRNICMKRTGDPVRPLYHFMHENYRSFETSLAVGMEPLKCTAE